MRPNALLLKAGIGHLSLDDQARQERPHKLLDLEFLKSEAGTNVPAKGGALYASDLPRQRLILVILRCGSGSHQTRKNNRKTAVLNAGKNLILPIFPPALK